MLAEAVRESPSEVPATRVCPDSDVSSNMNRPPIRPITQGPPPEQWKAMKPHIHRLYVQEGMTLQELMEMMSKKHDFKAS